MSSVERMHETFMAEAMKEAQKALEAGEVPIGCVVVRQQEIVGRGGNEIERTHDATRHAETVAIADACSTLGTRFLDDCTLYVTLEPCAMCAGAIVLARIKQVVYACADPKTGAVHSIYELLTDTRLNHQCVVRTGFMAEESTAMLQNFFAERRVAVRNQDEQVTSDPRSSRQGSLTLVPLPIGNIEDVTVRGLKMLKAADVIVCEDTRHTGQLLRRYGVQPRRMISNHDHNEHQRSQMIVSLVRSGSTVVLVSDAGTPGISDPGVFAVQACIEAGLAVTALPGASAVITGLSASGLPTDSFVFEGFPPHKKGRKAWLEQRLDTPSTLVLYESPHRLLTLLSELQEVCLGTRAIVIARELTKLHEEYIRGTIDEVVELVNKRGGVKGECVVMIAAERNRERQ